MSLQHQILMKKLRMAITTKKARRTNLGVLAQEFEEA